MSSENNRMPMPAWQRWVKRLMDILVSLTGLIVLSPLIAYVAVRVLFSSPGPVLYSQERLGLRGRKFRIRKFRSMYVGAESEGPMLSSDSDERVTRWGRTMRRWKLDELPQFWNVLVGEMSLVGPRPERAYYIRQLEAQQYPFSRLLQVRPGITSLGMVRYGYASSLPEMAERMQFDLAYMENRSLMLDMKILIRTLGIILRSER